MRNVAINAAAGIDDCRAVEARAQRDAIEDARERAKQIAAAAGLTLGAITNVSEAQNFPSPGCRSRSDPVEANNLPRDVTLSGPLQVPVTVFATVTFAVRPSSN